MKARVIYGLAAMFLLAAIAGSVQAASKSRLTTISVGLHCAGCGKKVVEALRRSPTWLKPVRMPKRTSWS